MYLIFIKKIYFQPFGKCSEVVEKYHVMFTLYYQYFVAWNKSRREYRFYGWWSKKKTGNISTTILFQPNCSCMFKRCIFIRILVLRTYSYLRIPLNGRFVFLYFSYSLCIFIFHVFCTSSINHYVALCKNSVNDVCKTMLSLYICTCTLRIIPLLSTFFQKTPPREESMRYLSCVSSIIIE